MMSPKHKLKAVGRLIGLGVVTLAAGAVMWATGLRSTTPPPRLSTAMSVNTEATLTISAPVVTRTLQPEQVEILDTYSGMIRPYERYSVAFEVAGRIRELGKHETGRDLDEGDRVNEGQILAVLDRRVLEAQVREMSARLEQAQQEFERARQMRDSPSRPISETEFQRRVTELAVVTAQSEQATKNLEDATLVAPCDGIISQRLVNAGESIGTHQLAFEIVQVERVLLIVGVPESRVQELENRWRLVREGRELISKDDSERLPHPDDLAPFDVHVQLMGTDRFGQPWPERNGRVFRIGETADDKTGLFEVEILLDNSDANLRPGQVALADIVIDKIEGVRIPVDSVLFRGDAPYVYTVREDQSDLDILFWNVGPSTDLRAHRVTLPRYIEQNRELIVPGLDEADRRVVVRGQHRLVEGRRVRIVSQEDTLGSGEADRPAESVSVPPETTSSAS